MAENIFKAGDTVKLKSGSPTMTIEGFATNMHGNHYSDRVVCIWFLDGQPKKETFMLSTLKTE